MAAILMMLSKIGYFSLLVLVYFTLVSENKGILKWRLWCQKVSAHGVINKFLSRDLNYAINVVMWPKFGRISKREVIITSVL